MHQVTQRVVLVAALLTCVALSAGSANAAYGVYLTVQGTRQGQFGQGRIPCESFGYQEGAHPGTGQSYGGVHDRITFVKRADKTSPQFFRAAATGEVLREVSVEFVQTLADGRERVYKTLRITNAVVAKVNTRTLDSAGASRQVEDITLGFDRREMQARDANGQLTPVQRWLTIQR